jgi:5-methylcytosine-specific restriction endonuclease McrA
MMVEAGVVLEAPPPAPNQRHEATTSMARPTIPYDGRVVTRAQAKALGEPLFFTNIPCKRGHLSQRRISDGCCVVCAYDDRTAWKAANRDKVNELERGYRERNNEAINARRRANYPVQKLVMRAYYETHAETIKAQVKARRLAEPDKHRAVREAYYAANTEAVKQRVAEHNALHPEKKLARCRNYRARVNGAEGSHTGDDIKALYEKQRGHCVYCDVELGSSYHVDHIVALSKGGSNWPSNLQLTCSDCNNRKRAMDHLEFARRSGKL